MLHAIFEDKHSLYDLGMVLVSHETPLPEPYIETAEVPGRDGVLDMTDALINEVRYKNRPCVLTFEIIRGDEYDYSLLAALIHGKKLRVWLTNDDLKYYYGRCTMSYTVDRAIGTVTVNLDADPYRYHNAETTKTVEVSGSAAVTLGNDRMPVSPVIYASVTGMTVEYNGVIKELDVTPSTIYDIRLAEGFNTLNFTGTGIVNISYRQGCF